MPEPAVKSIPVLSHYLMSGIHLFFKEGKRSYYPIVYPTMSLLISGVCKRLLASKGTYARNQFNCEVTSFAYRSLSYCGIFLEFMGWQQPWKFQIFSSMDDSFKKQQDNPGPLGQTSSGAEIDELKRMLMDTNPILLGTTFIVLPQST